MQSEEIEKKQTFVKKYLKPLLIAMQINIADVSYSAEHGEYVEVVYENQYKIKICVSCDSLRAIVLDVVRNIH